MLVRSRRSWEIPEAAATPEASALAPRPTRRELVLTVPAAMLSAAACGWTPLGRGRVAATQADRGPHPPAPRNARYVLDRPVTEESWVLRFTNYFEFSSGKHLAREASRLRSRPWALEIGGLCRNPHEIDVDDLLGTMQLEERLYRHRCVEAWAMAVPWSGFPLAALVARADPLPEARYLRFETFLDPEIAPRQKYRSYPFPYVEGLTLDEATHELAFLATGLYGKALAPQNGAPIRLVVPWKYGFKSIKAIRRMTFVAERPTSFWEHQEPKEYGFWANVSPDVPHPRWSQAEETMLGTGEDHPTRLFNGYAAEVAHLYRGLDGERLFV